MIYFIRACSEEQQSFIDLFVGIGGNVVIHMFIIGVGADDRLN